MKFVTSATALMLTALMTTAAFAADAYEIDPQHAWVNFALNHAGWSTANGSFDAVSGNISWDKDDVTKSTVSVEIGSASIHTGFADRDHDLQSPDFFNAEEFPTITFVSTAIEKTGDNTGKITGDLTIIGVTKSVILDAKFNSEAALPWDATALKAGFTATGTILPADFGMAKVAEYGLGPDVALTINIEAFKK
jgi:polyisoprenoid-binding protein YceI